MNPPREDQSAGQESVHAELREVLRLRFELKLEYQQIGRSCSIGVSTVHNYLKRAAALFRDLAIARADGSLRSLLVRLSRIDVLLIDDWAMAPMSEAERRDFWEIYGERQTRSTILTSQLPVARWHEQIGDPTAADGILDRLVHNAHRIDMRGDSMRKKTWSAAVELSAEAGTKGCRPLPRTLFSASGTLPPLRSGQFQTGFS